MKHLSCRNGLYGSKSAGVSRSKVPDDFVTWNVVFEQYKPIAYTSRHVLNKPEWADVDLELNNKQANLLILKKHNIEWNKRSQGIDRTSFMGEYKVGPDCIPINPVGRTGIVGRGDLGKWGPNHAADPIVTRWKRNREGSICVNNQGDKILQFIAIKRRDCGEWAIPGGMVDDGERVSVTLQREFREEALNTLEMNKDERRKVADSIKLLFSNGIKIFEGYVDDPRNTDNAWMETSVYNFHDSDHQIDKLNLHSGDDATGVTWMDITPDISLYANHSQFIQQVNNINKNKE